jgi:hypothetical protein
VFNYGIPGYEPHWIRERPTVAAAHGERLAALVGRPLTSGWVVWDMDDDTWFPDCPVLLDFDGEQVEITHFKFDDISITWDIVDPRQTIDWPDFHLRWRDDAPQAMTPFRDQVLMDVELLEWRGRDLAHGSVAVGFTFANGRIEIFNALDENGLSFDPPDPNYQRYSLRH